MIIVVIGNCCKIVSFIYTKQMCDAQETHYVFIYVARFRFLKTNPVDCLSSQIKVDCAVWGQNNHGLKMSIQVNFFSGDRRSVRPGAPSEPNEYNFNYHKRGLFIIINNKNFHPSTGKESREGTDVDAERLEERFQDLGFDVRRYNDVSSSKLLQLMNEGKQ